MSFRIGVAASLIVATGAVAQPAPKPELRQLTVPGNPLIADGSIYSADPAPLSANGKLYIVSGRDEAKPDENDFIMKEWQLFSTTDPKSGRWTDLLHALKPDTLFKWAEPGGAFASQIVKGPDGRFYLYAPVRERAGKEDNKFAIGVAVAGQPEGPYVDAHPAGPIASPRTPNSDIVNIDPTVLVDDDGRVYMYWGTFGNLRAVELDRDMVTLKGEPKTIEMRGFFEAPWLMKRKGSYYLLYADNEWHSGEKQPECTPAFYHACTGYASAPSPMGPWTYRGVMLRPVSSTTSHTGAVEFNGQWWLAYHTADAKGGGHFRRSVALDKLEWDDTASPPAIREVVQTKRDAGPPPLQRNVAPAAAVSASNEPIPGQYYIEALRDGKAHKAPLPPEIWGNWTGKDDRPSEWLQYSWAQPQTLSGTRIWFWNDAPAGAGGGVAPPKAWHVEYWDGSGWKPVSARDPYATTTGGYVDVRFVPVTTRCLRAILTASSSDGKSAALGVEEWEALATQASTVLRPPKPAMPCGTR